MASVPRARGNQAHGRPVKRESSYARQRRGSVDALRCGLCEPFDRTSARSGR